METTTATAKCEGSGMPKYTPACLACGRTDLTARVSAKRGVGNHGVNVTWPRHNVPKGA